MLKFFCKVTGDDYQLLKNDTPASKKKVTALASILFIPVMIWFFIGYLMVSQVLNGSWMCAIIVALSLSLLIFLIEKNIIMAPNSKSIMRLRILLGAIMALLGAVFIDEVLFKQDVDQQLNEIYKTTINRNLEEISAAYIPELNRAQDETDARYTAWQKSLNAAKNEADGTDGSGKSGVHAITRMKLEVAETNQADYLESKAGVAMIRTKMDQEKADKQKDLKGSLKSEVLLNRIKALFNLVFSDWAMGIIYLFFTAFLFILEFLVVFMKNQWPKTNYERRVEMIEEGKGVVLLSQKGYD